MLLEYGAKLDPINDEDLTPLHLSAKNGHVRYFIELVHSPRKLKNLAWDLKYP